MDAATDAGAGDGGAAACTVSTDCATRSHSTVACDLGACVYRCETGFGDCNGLAPDGCEADLAAPATCASCTTACTPRPHAVAACRSGGCVHDCASGFGDCDTSDANGCESSIDTVARCGSCGMSCAGEDICRRGACASLSVSGALAVEGGFDEPRVALSPSGAAWIAGTFIGDVALSIPAFTSSGGKDLFLAHVGADTTLFVSSAYQFGSTADEHLGGLAVDPSGNVYLAGTFAGPMDFGGMTITPDADGDIYLASVLPFGAMHRWTRKIPTTGVASVTDIGVDSASNLYVVGSFVGSIDLGDGERTSTGDADTFVASFGSDGTRRWSYVLAAAGGSHALAMDVAGDGTVWLVSVVAGALSFGGRDVPSSTPFSTLVCSLSSAGAPMFGVRFPVVSPTIGLAVSPSGQVGLSLTSDTAVDFGAGLVTPAGAPGRRDVYTVAFDSTGTTLWSRRLADTPDVYVGLAADDGGYFYEIGAFLDLVLPGHVPSTDSTAGVVSIDALGSPRWARAFGAVGSVEAFADLDAAGGNVWAVGFFGGTIDFGGGLTFTAPAARDEMMLVRFSE